MPVIVERDPEVIATLSSMLPPGTHAVDSSDRLLAWLSNRSDEYVIFLGPNVPMEEATALCDQLRISQPSTTVVIVRDVVDTDILSRAMQAGARDVVLTTDRGAVAAAVNRAQTLWIALRGPGGAAHVGQIITVFSPKGGVGKTTTSVNLALALSQGGARKVCLVDLDLAFGDVAITMQLVPAHTIEEAIGAEDQLDAAMAETLLTRHEDSLMVLSAPQLPDARDRITARLISRVLRTLKQQFDYVVVDTAPSFDEQTLQALDETDECVIVATLDVPTLKNVKVAFETLDLLSIAVDHRHLVLNRADDAVGLDNAKVEAILGVPIAVPIPTAVEVAAATNAGRPIVLSDPDHPASRAFRLLASTLSGEDEDGSDTPHNGTKKPDAERRGNRKMFRRG
ncbi:Flp pilus assembly protein ATPase CpaE-like protein [metagenome]|uniref:Flp pilus assembly protein ATPase CpaE-like protein n=1 Tax=metagenome TaxID=256318 RepID=A0A2P2BW48_9ZZZZ